MPSRRSEFCVFALSEHLRIRIKKNLKRSSQAVLHLEFERGGFELSKAWLQLV